MFGCHSDVSGINQVSRYSNRMFTSDILYTQELEVIEGIRILLSQKVSEGFDQLW